MRPKLINLFMWAYQPHFRLRVESCMNGVMEELGVPEAAAGCFRHQLLLPRPYLVLTKPLRLDIQCQRGASVKIGWKYLDD